MMIKCGYCRDVRLVHNPQINQCLTPYNKSRIKITQSSQQVQKKLLTRFCILPNQKEEVKLSLFADDVTLHIEIPTDATTKLLGPINKFSKSAGHKINM